MLFTLLYFIALATCCLLAVLFLLLAWARRKRKAALFACAALSVAFSVATVFLWRIDPRGGETTDRRKAAAAFAANFGFAPPAAIKEIKVKNYRLYDASAHWMAFTWEPVVLRQVLQHDGPLDSAIRGTPKYAALTSSLREGCANCPAWLHLPDASADKIFFKKQFLPHTSSEYYLWVNVDERMVYLEVSYFD